MCLVAISKVCRPFFNQAVEAVAATLRRRTSVGGHRDIAVRTRCVDVERVEKFQERAEPDRTAAWHDASPNTVMMMEPVREGSRLSWSTIRLSGGGMLRA